MSLARRGGAEAQGWVLTAGAAQQPDDVHLPTLWNLGVAAFVSLSQIATGAHSFSSGEGPVR